MSDIVERLRADKLPECSLDSGKTWKLDCVAIAEEREAAAAEIERLTHELNEIEAKLSDPVIVHINMLRGGIAKLPMHLVEHLYPSIREERDALKAQVAAQEAAITRHGERIGALKAENESLKRSEQEASTHIESIIWARTVFTGEAPYVGWHGLSLALCEALDERDVLKKDLSQARRDLQAAEERADEQVAHAERELEAAMDRIAELRHALNHEGERG